MGPAPFPSGVPVQPFGNPATNIYSYGGLPNGIFQCNSACDMGSGKINLLCLNDSGKYFELNRTTLCAGDCLAKTCGELPTSLCGDQNILPFALFDIQDGSYIDTCIQNSEGECQSAITGTDIVGRPGRSRYTHSPTWMVLDDSFGFGYDYKCSDKDIVDDLYFNVFCKNAAGVFDKNIHVYCRATNLPHAALEPDEEVHKYDEVDPFVRHLGVESSDIFGELQIEEGGVIDHVYHDSDGSYYLSTDPDVRTDEIISSYSIPTSENSSTYSVDDGDEVKVVVDCVAASCQEISGEFCQKNVDIYSVDGSYIETCTRSYKGKPCKREDSVVTTTLVSGGGGYIGVVAVISTILTISL